MKFLGGFHKRIVHLATYQSHIHHCHDLVRVITTIARWVCVCVKGRTFLGVFPVSLSILSESGPLGFLAPMLRARPHSQQVVVQLAKVLVLLVQHGLQTGDEHLAVVPGGHAVRGGGGVCDG